MGKEVFPLTNTQENVWDEKDLSSSICGSLRKLKKRGRGFNERFYKINRNHLYEYRSPKDEEPKSIMNLANSTVEEEPSHKNSIYIRGPFIPRKIILKAKSESQKQQWKQILHKAINYKPGDDNHTSAGVIMSFTIPGPCPPVPTATDSNSTLAASVPCLSKTNQIYRTSSLRNHRSSSPQGCSAPMLHTRMIRKPSLLADTILIGKEPATTHTHTRYSQETATSPASRKNTIIAGPSPRVNPYEVSTALSALHNQLLNALVMDNMTELDSLLLGVAGSSLIDNICKETGGTILHLASKLGKADATLRLVEAGANPNARDQDHRTPLHIAASQSAQVTQSLLRAEGIEVNAKDNHFDTPLHLACKPHSSSELCVQLLLKAGAELNIRNQNLQTALHIACNYGATSIVRLLLDECPPANLSQILSMQDEDKRTPLHIACLRSHQACAELLINAGADPYVNYEGKPIYDFMKHQFPSSNVIQRVLPPADSRGIARSRMTSEIVESTSESDEDSVIEVTQDVWLTGKYLGNGTFGEVRRCLDPKTGLMFVAKRFIRPIDSDTGEMPPNEARELQSLRSLRHPNIVRYLGYSIDEPYVYLCMQCVDGGSLHDLVHQHGSLSKSLIKKYTRQILKGLLYLHQNGVLHRDIKPANILVSQKAIIKLADFGGAKQIIAGDIADQSDDAQVTPSYAAPEIFNLKIYSKGSDVWSVGCTVLHMASGESPWSRQVENGPMGFMQILFQLKLKNRPEIPEECPPEVHDFIQKCTNIEHTQRPSCAELLAQHPLVREDRTTTQTSLAPIRREHSCVAEDNYI